jgi:hypothetical protein
MRNRDSSVGIVADHDIDGRGSIPGSGKTSFFSTASRPALRPTYPASHFDTQETNSFVNSNTKDAPSLT